MKMLKLNFDIEELLEKGIITNELDYERSLIADRKLRLLAKENIYFKSLRSKLRDIIEKYENAEWSDVNQIAENKLLESDEAECVAELERLLFENKGN